MEGSWCTDAFDSIETDDDAAADNLLATIAKVHTTSALNQLEHHRQKLNTTEFRSLLLSLTTKLNNIHGTKFVGERKRRNSKNNSQIPKKSKIDHCCYIILCYIVSVIHKYQIPSVEDLWNEILGNSLTKTKEFYQYLHQEKMMIPQETRESFSRNLGWLYAQQPPRDRLKLIELGFIFDGMITAQTSIKHVEQIFSILKQRGNQLVEPEKLIVSMNTPEKLSLFLSHFPDYDINQVNQNNRLNVLEQLLDMKSYFCLPRSDRSIIPVSQSVSRPNDMFKYRAVRIVNLLQQLISRGAQLPKPIYSPATFRDYRYQFFTSSIGIYVFLGLNAKDIYPSLSSVQRDVDFVLAVIRNLGKFYPEFREFILHRLTVSYSIVHQPKFMLQRRRTENRREQGINDRLFQQPIKLKDWCRLKIKDNCSQKHIQHLNLSTSLIDYCSFGFSDPNYALQSIAEVTKHKGNLPP